MLRLRYNVTININGENNLIYLSLERQKNYLIDIVIILQLVIFDILRGQMLHQPDPIHVEFAWSSVYSFIQFFVYLYLNCSTGDFESCLLPYKVSHPVSLFLRDIFACAASLPQSPFHQSNQSKRDLLLHLFGSG